MSRILGDVDVSKLDAISSGDAVSVFATKAGTVTLGRTGQTLALAGNVTVAGTLGGSGNLSLGDSDSLILGAGSDDTIVHNGTNTLWTHTTGDLTIDNTLVTGSTIIQMGTDTSATDVQVQNNTGTALLTIDGAGTVTVPLASQVVHSAGFLVPCYSTTAFGVGVTVGAIPLTPSFSGLTTTGADAFTLAAPGSSVPPGYIKEVKLLVDGGDATVTVTGLPAAHDVWTLSEIGQGFKLMAVDSTTWCVVGMMEGDTTVDSIPTYA